MTVSVRENEIETVSIAAAVTDIETGIGTETESGTENGTEKRGIAHQRRRRLGGMTVMAVVGERKNENGTRSHRRRQHRQDHGLGAERETETETVEGAAVEDQETTIETESEIITEKALQDGTDQDHLGRPQGIAQPVQHSAIMRPILMDQRLHLRAIRKPAAARGTTPQRQFQIIA